MEYTTGIILLAVFLVVVVLIVRGQKAHDPNLTNEGIGRVYGAELLVRNVVGLNQASPPERSASPAASSPSVRSGTSGLTRRTKADRSV
jgi:hypothetical protein